MKRLDAHGKLLGLLCFALMATGTLLLLAGCGDGLLPEQKALAALPLRTHDQLVEAFDQIVPGMTRAEDLTSIGFDASRSDVDVLSYLAIEDRFLPGLRWEQLDQGVQACIRARLYCTGYVFHPARARSDFISDTLARLTHGERQPADVVLLVMNGRVVHKVFSARASDAGGMVARADVSKPAF